MPFPAWKVSLPMYDDSSTKSVEASAHIGTATATMLNAVLRGIDRLVDGSTYHLESSFAP